MKLYNLKKPLLIRSKAILSDNYLDSIDEKWLYEKMIFNKNIQLKIFAKEFFKNFPEKLPKY